MWGSREAASAELLVEQIFGKAKSPRNFTISGGKPPYIVQPWAVCRGSNHRSRGVEKLAKILAAFGRARLLQSWVGSQYHHKTKVKVNLPARKEGRNRSIRTPPMTITPKWRQRFFLFAVSCEIGTEPLPSTPENNDSEREMTIISSKSFANGAGHHYITIIFEHGTVAADARSFNGFRTIKCYQPS